MQNLPWQTLASLTMEIARVQFEALQFCRILQKWCCGVYVTAGGCRILAIKAHQNLTLTDHHGNASVCQHPARP